MLPRFVIERVIANFVTSISDVAQKRGVAFDFTILADNKHGQLKIQSFEKLKKSRNDHVEIAGKRFPI